MHDFVVSLPAPAAGYSVCTQRQSRLGMMLPPARLPRTLPVPANDSVRAPHGRRALSNTRGCRAFHALPMAQGLPLFAVWSLSMEGPKPVSRLRPIALVLAVALATFFTQLGACVCGTATNRAMHAVPMRCGIARIGWCRRSTMSCGRTSRCCCTGA